MVRLFLVMIAGFGVGVVAFIGGLSAGGFATYKLMSLPPLIEPPRINYQTLEFPSSQTKLYLAARRWGLTGDHEEVRICTRPIDFGSDGTCLIFYTSELFYGRAGEKELVVQADSVALPDYQVTRLGGVDIKIHELNSDKHEAIRRDYDRRGLMRIDAP